MKTTFRKLIFGFLIAVVMTQAQAYVNVFIRIAPPPLPYYEQPLVPADGYLWTPGYWSWDDDEGDYYWVPGTWVLAPQPGYLWTPGYWAWDDFGYGYGWRPGYWALRVGYYGGINYGYGYYGNGYVGGRWYGNRFSYNRAVNNVNVVYIHNTYNTTVINRGDNRISYNGGEGGVRMRPRQQDQRIERERHLDRTESQDEHQDRARRDRGQFASVNQGRPQIGATQRPSDFRDSGSTPVREPQSRRNSGSDDQRLESNAREQRRNEGRPRIPQADSFPQQPLSEPAREPRAPRQRGNSEERPQVDRSERRVSKPFDERPDRSQQRAPEAPRAAPEPPGPRNEPAERRAPSKDDRDGDRRAEPAMRQPRAEQKTPRGDRRDRDQQ